MSFPFPFLSGIVLFMIFFILAIRLFPFCPAYGRERLTIVGGGWLVSTAGVELVGVELYGIMEYMIKKPFCVFANKFLQLLTTGVREQRDMFRPNRYRSTESFTVLPFLDKEKLLRQQKPLSSRLFCLTFFNPP